MITLASVTALENSVACSIACLNPATLQHTAGHIAAHIDYVSIEAKGPTEAVDHTCDHLLNSPKGLAPTCNEPLPLISGIMTCLKAFSGHERGSVY